MNIGFVCIGNSCRSQMAEGFAREYSDGSVKVFSAGTQPASEVNPKAIQVMEEVGISIAGQYPKHIDEIPELHILITMGCGVRCPYKACRHREDWGLEDPVGKDIEFFRLTRDSIRENVKYLLGQIEKKELP